MDVKILFDALRKINGKLTQKQVDTFNSLLTTVPINMLVDLLGVEELSSNKKTSVNGINIIKDFEGYMSKAYDDGVGVMTIGWGTTLYPDGTKVKEGDTCTKEQGVDVLISPTHKISAQALIDKTYYGMKDLTPTQFYYLLANSGLDDAIDVLLPPLRTENLYKYSMYRSYLNGARFYEFSKAYHMYLDIKAKILAVNPLLDYTLEQLKTLWLEASQV